MSETSDTAMETASAELEITRIFAAPREMVFRACTEADQLAKWWGPEGFTAPVCESDPRPGGTMTVVMRDPDGTDYKMTGTYIEVVAPERLVVESKALDQAGNVLIEATNTITFRDVDGKTELHVKAQAVALVPEAAPMLGGMRAGWTQSLQCLDDVLTGALDRQMVISRLFQASREVVYAAWTDPEQLPEWYGPKGFTLTMQEMDVRVGGALRFIFHGPDGTDYPNDYVYDEVVPSERLVMTHADPRFISTVTFDDFMGMTALTLRVVFETASERDETVEKVNAIERGNETLDKLAQHLGVGSM